MSVRVSPITRSDVVAVAEFLTRNMHGGIPAATWVEAMSVPWQADAPNRGFMLLDGDTVVGAYVAFYSERVIEGCLERFCNLGTWCVLPSHRFHSMRLTKALLEQPGYHFTDLSPGAGVAKLNARLGFRSLDSTVVTVRALPWPSWPGAVSISSSREVIEKTLDGESLEIYRDHIDAPAAHHIVLQRGREWCYVMFRKATPGRVRKVPFVWILYVSDPALFNRCVRPFARHMLFHYGAQAIRAELRIIRSRPRPSSLRQVPHVRRMYKSSHLEPDQIDYLYSELTCVAW